MQSYQQILIDFFEDNIRRFFWGFVVMSVAGILWYVDEIESAKTLIIGVGTFALTQFRGNLPRPEEPRPRNEGLEES